MMRLNDILKSNGMLVLTMAVLAGVMLLNSGCDDTFGPFRPEIAPWAWVWM